MRIAHITPGTGGQFYCQNCFRDGSLLDSSLELGHEIYRVPMYLPLSLDHHTWDGDVPVFYGAINVYLKEKSAIYRGAPSWVEQIFDSGPMLRMAARLSGSTKASGLEEMTLSMLRGEAGKQASELDRLVTYLDTAIRPDVVHLSNALLLGLARQVKRDLGCKVICSLQDENEWIDPMSAAYQQQVWGLMAERAVDVDLFVAASNHYARLAGARLGIPATRIEVVYAGIDLEGYEVSPLPLDPPVIGYLSRMSESLGLGILVDAFLTLRRDPGFRDLRLHITGGHAPEDRAFLRRIRKAVKREGCEDAVRIFEAFDRPDRIAFLKSLTLMSVPVPAGEAFGTYQIEALAAGVPVLQPNAGGFPEFIEATGGGAIYEPNDSRTLAEGAAALLRNPERLRHHAEAGRRAVRERFSIQNMVRNMARVYEKALGPAQPSV
jgi:glycosyltransferase involved in cell wall biosynthesis